MSLLFQMLFAVGLASWYVTREQEFWVSVVGWAPMVAWLIWLEYRIESNKEEK